MYNPGFCFCHFLLNISIIIKTLYPNYIHTLDKKKSRLTVLKHPLYHFRFYIKSTYNFALQTTWCQNDNIKNCARCPNTSEWRKDDIFHYKAKKFVFVHDINFFDLEKDEALINEEIFDFSPRINFNRNSFDRNLYSH